MNIDFVFPLYDTHHAITTAKHVNTVRASRVLLASLVTGGPDVGVDTACIASLS